MTNRKLTAAQTRVIKQKSLMLEHLKKNPIVQAACEKLDIGRATHYRWCKEDTKYAEEVDIAIIEGIALCNDYAESQLLSAIQSNDTNAVKFWLRSNHPRYKNKIELNGTMTVQETLTPEQETVVREALKLVTKPKRNSHE